MVDSPPAAAVRVVEVIAETEADGPEELPLHLAGAQATVSLQLRSTLRRVGMGAGVARRPEIVEAVRALPGAPRVLTTPAGGTFTVGGPGWLGLAAVGVPPAAHRMRLDWMTDAVRGWFAAALGPFGLEPATGRIEGAWCPGFSDISVGGRKLTGLGFRVTRDWIAMRGMLTVRPIDDADHALLVACHRLIGVEVRREASTSLVEATGDPSLTVESVIRLLGAVATG